MAPRWSSSHFLPTLPTQLPFPLPTAPVNDTRPGIDIGGGNPDPLNRLAFNVCRTAAESAVGDVERSYDFEKADGGGLVRSLDFLLFFIEFLSPPMEGALSLVAASKFGSKGPELCFRTNTGLGLMVGVAPVSLTMSTCCSPSPSASLNRSGSLSPSRSPTSSPRLDALDCDSLVLPDAFVAYVDTLELLGCAE